MSDAILTAAVTLAVGILTLLGGGIAAAVVAGKLTRAVKISEFRVKWIEELRDEIANFIGASHRWIRLYEEYNDISPDRSAAKTQFEKEQLRPIQNDALVILYRIRMRINPLDDNPTKAEDSEFLRALLNLLNPGKFNPDSFESSWMKSADATVEMARRILKREWEETKKPKA